MIVKVLISYAYFKTIDLSTYAAIAEEAGNELQLFIDSGAVSAQNLGWDINLSEYCEWVKANKRHIQAYANLDVIGDPKATHANQMFMEKRGLKPIPIYHRGEAWSHLEKLVGAYPYIGIGGAVKDSVNNQEQALMRWLIGVFRRVGTSKTVVHGFGLTRMALLSSFPFYSADASSWQLGAQYGTLRIFDRRTGRMKAILQHDGVTALKFLRLIRDYGEDPKHFAGGREDGYHYNEAIRVGIWSFQGYEAWLKNRHGPVKLARKPAGLHLYAATASTNHIKTIAGLEGQPEWITQLAAQAASKKPATIKL